MENIRGYLLLFRVFREYLVSFPSKKIIYRYRWCVYGGRGEGCLKFRRVFCRVSTFKTLKNVSNQFKLVFCLKHVFFNPYFVTVFYINGYIFFFPVENCFFQRMFFNFHKFFSPWKLLFFFEDFFFLYFLISSEGEKLFETTNCF